MSTQKRSASDGGADLPRQPSNGGKSGGGADGAAVGGPKRFHIENNGLWMFVYDEANEPILREQGALERITRRNEGDGDCGGAELARGARLVAWELFQEGPRTIDVSIGDSLLPAEKRRAKWHEPQMALLSLPSGRMRIHSWRTCPLGEASSDPAAALDVPPGEYVLALHRVAREATDEECYPVPPDVPTERIILTPIAEAKLPTKPRVALTLDALREDLDWTRRSAIREGGIDAEILRRYPSEIETTIEPRVLDRLGFVFGQRLRFETASFQREAIYLGHASRWYVIRLYGIEEYESRFVAAAPFAAMLDPKDSVGVYNNLRLRKWDPHDRANVLPEGDPVGAAIRIVAAPGPPVVVMDDAVGRWGVDDGVLRTRVLLCGRSGLLVDASDAALEKLGSAASWELSIGGVTRRVKIESRPEVREGYRVMHTRAEWEAIAEVPAAAAIYAEMNGFMRGQDTRDLTESDWVYLRQLQADFDASLSNVQATWPLQLKELHHPLIGGAKVLRLRALQPASDTYLDVVPGTEVELRRAT